MKLEPLCFFIISWFYTMKNKLLDLLLNILLPLDFQWLPCNFITYWFYYIVILPHNFTVFLILLIWVFIQWDGNIIMKFVFVCLFFSQNNSWMLYSRVTSCLKISFCGLLSCKDYSLAEFDILRSPTPSLRVRLLLLQHCGEDGGQSDFFSTCIWFFTLDA